MNKTWFALLAGLALALAPACGSDEAAAPSTTDGGAGSAGSDGGVAGSAGAAGSAGDAGAVTLDLVPGCNPFATSDECALPYPSAFFQKADATSATGVREDYPAGLFGAADATGANPIPVDVAPYNSADGVSPAAPILLHYAEDVKLDNLPDQHHLADSMAADAPIQIFNADTGERVPYFAEMDQNRVSGVDSRYAFIIRPVAPFTMGARHVVAITNKVVAADGSALPSPKGFDVLRDGTPTTNKEIEDVRAHYEDIFTFLESKGLKRADLSLAWDFTVASKDYVLGSVLSMRTKALSMLGTTGMPYTITNVDDRTASTTEQNVAKIIDGDFEVPTYLNAGNTFDYDAQHHPTIQTTNRKYPFTMVIPRKAMSGAPLPLVIFGHGLFGNGRDYLETGGSASILQGVAQDAGVVLLATDWIGLSSADVASIVTKVGTDLNNLGIVTDQLQQSLINNLAMTKLARGALASDAAVQIAGSPAVDTARTYYFGISLGGIQGTSFVAISDDVTRGVLNVPGAAWATMFTRSSNWPPVHAAVAAHYPDPLEQQIGIALIQSRFDFSDPANFAKLIKQSPLADAPSNRLVLLQESIGDCQVPNITTEMLARSMGVKLMTPSVTDVFGLDTVASPTSEDTLVQYQLTALTDQYMPPETNVPPSKDNGVHSTMISRPEALSQVEWLVDNGEIKSFCANNCVF